MQHEHWFIVRMTENPNDTDESFVSQLNPDTFIGFATEEDFPDEDCACCEMIREEIRNGVKWENHRLDLEDFDEDDLFED